ncbi:MAG: TraB/GumN family protein [Euryarchaeota archaeon]|nr:TraB/GumN family protein [Euryarchaeota archaeon]
MITIIGTAHISEESVEEVRQRIQELKPAVVAVELDERRLRGLQSQEHPPIVELLKRENPGVLLFSILMMSLQTKLGREVGVQPGSEMLAAIEAARQVGAQVALIDRDLRVTLRRAFARLSLREKLSLLRELMELGGVSKDEIEKEMRELKNEEHLSDVLSALAEMSPALYEVLVRERDAYMAARLLELERQHGNVVAVVGAGHRKGIQEYLENPERIPDMRELISVPSRRFSFLRLLKFAIPAAVVALFALALYRGVPVGDSVLLWLANHMVPTFIAVLLARGTMLSAVAGALASPLTSLNPMLAAGWFAGYVEASRRRVTVKDVAEMFSASAFSELMRNSAFRVVLVTALGNLGSALGTFISLPTVLMPLYARLMGA